MTIKELKQKMIEEFKTSTGLDEMMPVIVFDENGEYLKGRIDYFRVNEDTDEVEAVIQYCDEMGGWFLGRKRCITKEMLRNNKVKILKDEDLTECFHYWEYISGTGRYHKVLTLGGMIEKEYNLYRCRFCGKEKIY